MSDIRKRTGAKGTTYQVRYINPNTKTGYGYKSFKTLKEARAYIESGAHLSHAPKMTIAVTDAVDLWLRICEKVGRDGREAIEPETLLEYARRARVMKAYSWSKKLHEIDRTDVVRFRTWLLETQSRDMARRTLSSFHSVLIEMGTQGYIKDDPASGICIRSDGRHDDTETLIPTDNEMLRLLETADAMGRKNNFMRERWGRYRPMIYLAAFSGMRPSEYRGITWENVGNGVIEVVQRADASGRIGPVKSKAAKRRIFIPALVSDMLDVWRIISDPKPTDLVFGTDSGRPMNLRNIYTGCWMPLLKEAGLPHEGENKYTLYCLRHYFASKLIENGSDLKYIQEVMGHSKIEITLNVYGHLIKGKDCERRAFAEQLAAGVLELT